MKLLRLALSLVVLLIPCSLMAQKVSISKTSLTKSDGYGAVAKSAANQLLAIFGEPASVEDYNRLFRLQLCAAQYEEGVQTLRKFRALQADQQWEGLPAIGIQFELMGLSYAALNKDAADTGKVIYETAQQLYHQLPQATRPYVEQYFHPDLENIGRRFEQSRLALLNAPKGKVDADDAVQFCKLFLALEIARSINPHALRFLLEEDNRNYAIDDSLLLPGADSAQLTAVVVRKKDQTDPQPVILVYSVYAGPGDLGIAKRAADHGYVGVVVNTRGKGLSHDTLVPFEFDGRDSWFVLDYLSKQEFCDGRIGMYGGSYAGFTQWSAMKRPHPALKTIVPQVAVAPGIDFPQSGGVYNSYCYQWLRTVTNNQLTDWFTLNNTAYWDSLNSAWYRSGLPFSIYDSLAGKKNQIFRKWLAHPAYDSYWQSMVPYAAEFAEVKIPVLTITGYFDDDQYGALYYYLQHQQYASFPEHYVVIGPWDHYGAQSSPAEELKGYVIDSIAQVKADDLVFEWMDYIFRAAPKPSILRDKVNLQVMGENTWWSGASLQSGLTDSLQLHLLQHTDGKLELTQTVPLVTRRILLERKNCSAPDKQVAFDAQVMIQDTAKPDLSGLYFRSDALKDTSYIHGRYALKLRMLPECFDADLVTRLYEETADGRYFLLGSGIRRISYVPLSVESANMTPGDVYDLRMESLYFTERKLLPGSRLVLWLDIHAAENAEFNTGINATVSNQTRKDFKGIQLNLFSESQLSIPLRKQ